MTNFKWNWPLTFLAVLNCLLLFMIGYYFNGLGQGMAIFAVIVYPIYILLFTVLLIIVTLIKRKTWFTKGILFSSLILLLFCTPLPLVFGFLAMQPSVTTSVEASYDLETKQTTKTEKDRKHGKTIAVRHWIKGELDNDFVKHGIWVYFDSSGDTTTTEFYKQGTLIGTR